ncbi:MAG: indole-3-glycerol phosphate synthase TrpC [Bryobacterales bacterium]|nr:indole-3-glycerol phosphate synthase TrpC [Bryobacterales bacterium]
MVPAVPDILARIVEQKRVETAAKRSQEQALTERAYVTAGGRRDFAAALASRAPAIIAEIKKASPSKGVLSESFDPESIAASYEAGGAVALSVLTDETHFQGNLAHLRAARRKVTLPVLRKDFTIDDIDIIEAAAHGADAVLLIAALLTRAEMERFRRLASAYAMAALVEVHNERELEQALESGALIVGVNNRDLRTFEVRLETSERLAPKIPGGIIRVAESGVHSHADVRRLADSGFQAFLVGEHLMKSGDPAAALRALAGCS